MIFNFEDNVTNRFLTVKAFKIIEGIVLYIAALIHTKEDKMREIQSLQNQIWITRMSRVNAEKRLADKENFIQGINIYYSCVLIIFSILTLFEPNDKLSLVTVFMTIVLLIMILYFNGQRHLQSAREYRKNYTELQKLEFELEHLKEDEVDKISKIENRYCELMDSSSNHITYDYYMAVYRSKEEYKSPLWDNMKGNFWWNRSWRFCVKGILIVLPVALYIFCGGI